MSKYQLEIWEDVETAIAEVVKYYKPRNKSLDFLSDLDNKLEIIYQNPFAFQVRFRNVRSVQLKAYPFTLLYEVEEYNIRIIDLVHSNSDWLR